MFAWEALNLLGHLPSSWCLFFKSLVPVLILCIFCDSVLYIHFKISQSTNFRDAVLYPYKFSPFAASATM